MICSLWRWFTLNRGFGFYSGIRAWRVTHSAFLFRLFRLPMDSCFLRHRCRLYIPPSIASCEFSNSKCRARNSPNRVEALSSGSDLLVEIFSCNFAHRAASISSLVQRRWRRPWKEIIFYIVSLLPSLFIDASCINESIFRKYYIAAYLSATSRRQYVYVYRHLQAVDGSWRAVSVFRLCLSCCIRTPDADFPKRHRALYFIWFIYHLN